MNDKLKRLKFAVEAPIDRDTSVLEVEIDGKGPIIFVHADQEEGYIFEFSDRWPIPALSIAELEEIISIAREKVRET